MSWVEAYHEQVQRCTANTKEETVTPDTVTFQPVFELHLRRLGIRDRFVYNIFNQWKDDRIVRKIEQLKQETRWSSFINYAFTWSETAERHTYWQKIAHLDISRL